MRSFPKEDVIAGSGLVDKLGTELDRVAFKSASGKGGIEMEGKENEHKREASKRLSV